MSKIIFTDDNFFIGQVGSDEIIFTKTEAKVLQSLVSTGRKSRAELLVETQNVPVEIADKFETRSLDVTVMRLRKKLPEGTINSIRGYGYTITGVEVR